MSQQRVNRIVSKMFSTGRVIHEYIAGAGRRDPLSMLKLQTLRYVATTKQPPMKEVARFLCVAPPSATAVVGTLVRDGLLKRTTDRHDRRTVRLALTPLGRRFIRRGEVEASKRLAPLVQNLSAREQDQFIAILEKLATAHT